MTALITAIWPYVAGAVAALLGALAIRQSGKKAGRAEVEQARQQALEKQRGKVRIADEKVSDLDGTGVRDEFAKWVRKPGDR